MDFAIMKRNDLIQKEKVKNNLSDMGLGTDHEHFDIMHADFNYAKQQSN